MKNTTFSDVTQCLIEHYSDDKDRLNFGPSPELWEKAKKEVAHGERKSNGR